MDITTGRHVRRVRQVLAGGAVAAMLATGLTACAGSPPEAEAENGTVTIYLTRHGQTMLNALHRVQGWSDSPLTTTGEQIARDLCEGLVADGVEFEAAYSADMVRHFDTATLALACSNEGLEPIRDPRLREIAFGVFEAGTDEEMWTAAAESLGYADQASMFGAGVSFHDGLDAIAAVSDNPELTAETSSQVVDRARAALDDIARTTAEAGGGEVLVVSSGLTILLVLLDLGVDFSEVPTGIANAAVSTLVYSDGEWVVESVNDKSYVEAGASD